MANGNESNSSSNGEGGRARIKTGIAGLDSMLYGGIPEMSQFIIAGGPGAGKTLLSFDILYRNAKKGVPCAFIALEEKPEDVIKNAKAAFPDYTDIDALIQSNMLVVDGDDPATRISEQEDSETYSFGNIMSDIEAIAKMNNAKLVAIDSFSVLRMLIGDNLKYRKSILAMITNMKRLGITSIITTEIKSSERKDIKFGIESFVFDGIITLYQNGQEDKRTLTLEIIKTRGTAHSWTLSPYDITPQGFRVFSLEQ
ncbi:MAG TPA: ATPase domain-containing protein [Candidatus Acidoferrales bacterium]|nr:ATPase domain-containing protein [Candidatus Acidoferrales bacterium]